MLSLSICAGLKRILIIVPDVKPVADIANIAVARRDRLGELDSLRGIAIIAVACYHYLYRFPEFYPYAFRVLPVWQLGSLGVELFFVISGFVIALTLQASASPNEFAVRRMSRLLPAMIACSVLTYAILHMVQTPFADLRRVGWQGFVPSWTFTSPELWRWLLPEARFIDGAYWSLFVEIRFYILISIIYFTVSRRHYAVSILAICLAATLAEIFTANAQPPFLNRAIRLLFFPDYLPLFVVGVFSFELFKGKRTKPCVTGFCLAAATAIAGALTKGMGTALVISGVICVFVLLIVKRELLAFLNWRPLQWLGVCSYSFYLLHQNIGMLVITQFPAGLGPLAAGLVIMLTIALIALLASGIYIWVERPGQRLARRFFAGRSNRLQAAPAE